MSVTNEKMNEKEKKTIVWSLDLKESRHIHSYISTLWANKNSKNPFYLGTKLPAHVFTDSKRASVKDKTIQDFAVDYQLAKQLRT